MRQWVKEGNVRILYKWYGGVTFVDIEAGALVKQKVMACACQKVEPTTIVEEIQNVHNGEEMSARMFWVLFTNTSLHNASSFN